ncbi:TolC family protein [Salmonella enterica]|nr:TolC family protein [Salmonella enterica]EAN8394040.1 TolC family protein [Salmonella enterica subsp. arizonae serovar 13,23:gz51:-]EBF3615596.1 TolC family protein [Salmonella enterica subsp. arizonae serovar [1],13,23:g,z51:-]EBR4053404.1 TolC family protein [Salmonella enterica subsp. enterica]ECL5968149.1 TolC family protein [Salmonella enterica subsp. enterica serovar [1],13,23:g,z51:-]
MKIKHFLLTAAFVMQGAHASEFAILPLSKLVDAALKHQPSVAVSYYETEKKKSDLEATRASLYPTLDLSSGINNNRKESSGDERNIENKISLSYRITDFGVRGANIRKSEYEKNSSDIDYEKTKNTVAQEVITTYYNISKYREMIDGINKEKEFYKNMLGTFSLLVSSGVAMQSDLRKVQVSIDALNTRNIMYQSMLDDEMYKMKNMTGMQLSPDQIQSDEHFDLFKKYIFVDSPEKLMNMVMKYNDDYKMLVSARKAASEDINAANYSYFPTVDLVSSYVQNNPSGSAKKSDYENEFKTGVNVSFNIFNGFRNSAQESKMVASYSQAKLQIDDFLLKTRYNIDSQLSKYSAAKETYLVAERSHKNALQLTGLYEQEFQLGQKSLLDLISSRNEAFQAYVSMVDSKYSLYMLKLQQLSLVFHLIDYLKGNSASELNITK